MKNGVLCFIFVGMDKKLKKLNRYITRVYPELLSENIEFYKAYNRFYSTVDSIYVIKLSTGKYVLSIEPESGYKVLVDSFGEDLFLEWFNTEHYIDFFDLFGEKVLGNRSFISGITYSM